jgi:hypothetical protein
MTGRADPPLSHVPLVDDWSLWRAAAVRSAGLPYALVDGFAVAPDAGEPAARAATARAGRQLVRDDRYVAAVTWQNPALVDNWLGSYAASARAGEDADLARRDQRETVLATLGQRYCAKNETIGFFGPVAWACLDPAAAEPLTWTGDGALGPVTVFLEWHAVAAIAAAVTRDPELAAQIPLRRHPLCAAAGGLVYPPRGAPGPATPERYRLLAALGQPQPRDRLLAAAGGQPALAAALDSLLADGLVRRELVPPLCERPDQWLLAAVAALDPAPARDAWLDRLRELDAARAGLAAVSAAPDALRAGLRALEEQVARLAGAATGRAGHRYGRTSVYLDCRRDLTVTVGGTLLDDLRAPLGLLLGSARWLVDEVGAEVETELRTRYERLARDRRPVSLSMLLLASADVLTGVPGSAVDRVQADFTARWAEVLEQAGPDGRLATADVRGLATALFPDPAGVPWQAARQHSPDLMLRRRPGRRPQWVLGELHLALNTLENRPFVTQAADRELLLAAARRDFGAGRVVPVWPSSSPEVTSRTYPPLGMDLPDLYDYWSYALDEGRPDGGPTAAGPALLVDLEAGRLVAGGPDGGGRWPVLEYFGEFLTALVVNRFQLRAPAPYQPRLLFDDVLVERAAWRVPVGELPSGDPDRVDYLRRDLAAALDRLGCPRRVFCRLPGEPKPFLVDRQAPALLRALARALRRAADRDPSGTAVLTEMVPGPDELWLPGPDGDHCTSEFRMVVSAPAGPDRDRGAA